MKLKYKILRIVLMIFLVIMLSIIYLYHYIANRYHQSLLADIHTQIQLKQEAIQKTYDIGVSNIQKNSTKYKEYHQTALALIQHQLRQQLTKQGSNQQAKLSSDDLISLDLDKIKRQLITQYNMPSDVELFLINRQLQVYDATFKPDIGLDLSIFPQTSQDIQNAFNNNNQDKNQVYVSNLVAQDKYNQEYKVYSYSGLTKNSVLELSFIDNEATIARQIEKNNQSSSDQLSASVHAIFKKADNRYFYLLKTPKQKNLINNNSKDEKKVYKRSPLFSKEAFPDKQGNPIMHAFFTGKQVQYEDPTTHVLSVYVPLSADSMLATEYENLIIEYQVSLKAKYQFLAMVQQMFFVIILIALFGFVFLYLFLRNKLTLPINIITKSIKNNDYIQIESLSKTSDEFTQIANEYNQLFKQVSLELEKNRKSAVTDALTGIANRKAFDMAYKALLDEYSSSEQPFCLSIIDIDNFKQINDNFGHHTGDRVLCEVAEILTSLAPKHACAFRIGGEEFAVLFANTALTDAIENIQQYRCTIAERFASLREESVTISAGLSMAQPNDDYRVMYVRVDKLLYQAKNTGKNKVCF